MSRLDEPTDPGSVRYSAQLTVTAHEQGRPCCVECPGDGCGQEKWARDELRRAGRPALRLVPPE